MCYICHAQLFEITHAENIKSPLEQHSCRNAKVVQAFCDAGCRLSTQCRPSIHQPLVDALRVVAEIPTALSSVPLHADMHVASCWRRAYHRERRRHAILIALAALLGATLLATSCLGAFWTPAPIACPESLHSGVQKPAQQWACASSRRFGPHDLGRFAVDLRGYSLAPPARVRMGRCELPHSSRSYRRLRASGPGQSRRGSFFDDR
jgi:hypothetical protein